MAGSEHVVKGEGLSNDDERRVGDLHVHFDIKLPTEIDPDQKRLCLFSAKNSVGSC